MSALKIVGILIAGFIAVIVLANVIAFVAFSGTDSPVQAQPTDIQPTPAPTAPPLKVGLDITVVPTNQSVMYPVLASTEDQLGSHYLC